MNKDELRQYALKKRKLLECKELSEQIIENLKTLKEYKESKNILSYHSIKYEVNTTSCNFDRNKNVYLPRVNGDLLDICPLVQGCLEQGSFGILEPTTQKITDYSIIDIVLIPACAVDKNGFRLGYGKGYYDRLLPRLSENCKKIVLIYSELIFESVYPKKYDKKTDIIVSENGIIRC